MCDNSISVRMAQTVDDLLPGIDATVKDRSSTLIDLATAENWLIREELVPQYKTGIQRMLSPKVPSPSRVSPLLPQESLTRKGTLWIDRAPLGPFLSAWVRRRPRSSRCPFRFLQPLLCAGRSSPPTADSCHSRRDQLSRRSPLQHLRRRRQRSSAGAVLE